MEGIEVFEGVIPINEEKRLRKNERERAAYARRRWADIDGSRARDAEKARKRRLNHGEKVRETDRQRYRSNPEKYREQMRDLYRSNSSGRRDKALAYQKALREGGGIRRRLINALVAARARARKYSLPCDLKIEDLGDPECCAVTGITFDMSGSIRDGHVFGPSIDRIKPELGYVRGNVRVVVHCYNLAKNTGTDEDVYLMSKAVVSAWEAKNA